MNELERSFGLAQTPGYHYADRDGDVLYVAGQVPLDGAGQLVGVGDVASQARACLDNLDTLLRAHGFAKRDIRRLSIHVIGDQAQLGLAWGSILARFPDGVPPATLLGVPALGHEGQLVEIDATVVRRPRAS